MRRDLFFLGMNTILLAVIAFTQVTMIRKLDEETHRHRLRNEAESLCQLEAQQRPIEQRENLKEWLKVYEDCVVRRSGLKPPEGLRD